jgi:hypothetical protein
VVRGIRTAGLGVLVGAFLTLSAATGANAAPAPTYHYEDASSPVGSSIGSTAEGLYLGASTIADSLHTGSGIGVGVSSGDASDTAATGEAPVTALAVTGVEDRRLGLAALIFGVTGLLLLLISSRARRVS